MSGWQVFGCLALVVCFGGFGVWMTRGRMALAVACLILGGVGFGVALDHVHADQRADYCEGDR